MDMVGTWGAAGLGRELRCKWRSGVLEVRLQWLSQCHFCPMYKYAQNLLPTPSGSGLSISSSGSRATHCSLKYFMQSTYNTDPAHPASGFPRIQLKLY